MTKTNPKVDAFMEREGKWLGALQRLRAMILEAGLTEDLKWGQPCYTVEGANVIIIHGFKDYCALLFFKGALMKDPANILIQQTQNVQAGRQIRFTSLEDIVTQENALRSYIDEAVAVEKAGLKVEYKQTRDFAVPEEFQVRLDGDAGLKKAFEALTPGRQKAYLLHFAGAKQAKTREARIDKHYPRILDGKGLDD